MSRSITIEANNMETRNSASAIVRQPGEGARRWFFGGGVHTWKATEQETAGAFLLFEDEMSLHKVTPLHTHPESDETLYVLVGEILFSMEGTEHRLATGGVAVAHAAFRTPSKSCRREPESCACRRPE
jgi:quercetin dioxygenase-like cupin family protein